MNKIVQALLYIILGLASHSFCVAQNARSTTPEVKPIYSISKIPDGQTDESPSSQNATLPERPRVVDWNHQGSSKKLTGKQEPNSTNAAAKTTSTTQLDKYGNPVQKYTEQQKAELNDESLKKQDDANNTQPDDSKNTITYPDLQVTATKEEVTPSQNVGTERQPNSSSSTKNPTDTNDQKNSTTSPEPKIGKVEFLKQYVEELKILIEKNKNDPNYSLAGKQKELEDLENLLKQ